MPGPLRARDGGVEVFLRVQPGARREGIEGIVTGADGQARIKLALTTAPEGGKANARLIALLAKRWDVPKSAITITRGETARAKTVLVTGAVATILARIEKDLSAIGNGT